MQATAAGVLIALTAAGCGQSKGGDTGDTEKAKQDPVVQVSLTTVQRAAVHAAVPVTGTLAPLPNQEARVAPMTAGRLQRLSVKTGDQVTKGQVIATLDPGPLLGQAQQAEATVRADTATLRQARLNLQAQQNMQTAAVEQARTNLKAQQVALDKLLAGARPQEIAQAQTTVTSAQAALTNAQQNLARSQTLYHEGIQARKDLEAAQAEEKTARAQLSSAEEALSLVQQGSRPQDIEAGRVAVQQAQDQLRAAQAQSVQNASKAQDITIAAHQLQAARGALQAAQSQLSALTIRAPLSGTVVGRTLNPGESVDTTASVAAIVNLDRVRLLLNVPVAQIAFIHAGQTVEFSEESHPNIMHRALVTVVNKSVDPATNTIQVEAIAENADHRLRDDGFVRGQIITTVHPHTLVVPTDAVVEKDGKVVVFVVGKDNIAHAKEVKTGLREGQKVEIQSGLQEGERIVTTGAYELDDGTQVKAAP